MPPTLAALMVAVCCAAGPADGSKIRLIEDHSQAVGVWLAEGVSGMRVLHIDAHLDIGPQPSAEALAAVRSMAGKGEYSQIQSRSGYFQDRPLVGINNPMNFAHDLGLVSEVIWVHALRGSLTPDDLSSYQRFLRQFRYFSDGEIDAFRLEDAVMKGRLQGVPVTVTSLQDLGPIKGQVLLDVDLDIFGNEAQGRWPSATMDAVEAVLRALKERAISFQVATISFSVNGGHTPTLFRFLGEFLSQSLAGRVGGSMAWEHHRRALERLGYSDLYGGLDELEREEALAGKRAWISYLRSRFSLALGDSKRSAAHMREAFQLDPSYISGFVEDSQAALEAGDLERASSLATAGLDLAAGYAPLQDVLGSARFNAGDFGGALALYREVARSRPSNPLIHAYIGDALVRLGRTDEAVSAYEDAVRLHRAADDGILPDRFYLALSDLYVKRAQKGKARKLLEGLAALNPRAALPEEVRIYMDSLQEGGDARDGRGR